MTPPPRPDVLRAALPDEVLLKAKCAYGQGVSFRELGNSASYEPMRDVLVAALSAALDAPMEDGWQPIETAPKDGSWILVFEHKHHVDYWGCCQWLEFDDGSSGWIGSSFHTEPSGSWTTFLNPTSWQPLPAPPAWTREDR